MRIALQLATRQLHAKSSGVPLSAFDWFILASVPTTASKGQDDAPGNFHRYVGLAISVLVVLHPFAVFKHLVVDGDDTLARMIGMSDEPVVAQAD